MVVVVFLFSCTVILSQLPTEKCHFLKKKQYFSSKKGTSRNYHASVAVTDHHLEPMKA